jgi:co-chaperonin GroES (HSP10)
MTYHPTGENLLVELVPTPEREGSIYIPDKSQMRSQVGRVKAIGERVDKSMGIRHGDLVYMDPFMPDKRLESADGKPCMLVKAAPRGGHVLAVVGREW